MIFISYRRSDTQQVTGRIREQLADRYGADNVFLDIHDIAPGRRFLNAIRDALRRCDVLLVLIGARWIDARNRARLFQRTDVVRKEIETGLESGIDAIPVIIDRAPFPTTHQIPRFLQPLLALNAAHVDSGVDFQLCMERLTARIAEISAAATERRAAISPRVEKWQLLSQPTVEAVGALACNSREPDRLYASALLARRILRGSADGARWLSYATVPDDASCKCLAISAPHERRIVWVGTTGRLLQYHEAGFHWRDTPYFTALGERAVRWIAVNPSAPAHMLVGTGRYSSGTTGGAVSVAASGPSGASLDQTNWKDDVGYGDLHGTRDGGITWRTGPFRNVNRILFAETDPRRTYVATADDGLFVSANDAASFDRAPATENETLWSAAVSPHDAKHVVLGTQLNGALVTTDAGQTWSRPAALDKASVLCAVFSSIDPSVLLVGTEDGVFLSNDGGRTFAASNRGLVHQRALAALPLLVKGFIIGTDGGGMYVRAGSVTDWRPVHRGLIRSGVSTLVFDADDVLYIGAGDALYKSEDHGRSFQPLYHRVQDTIRAVCPLASSTAPGGVRLSARWNRYNVLLVGTEDGRIHRSDDYGETWQRVLDATFGPVRKIACFSASPTLVYAVAQGRELYESHDEGRTWSPCGAAPFMPITFAASEERPDVMLIGTFEGGVLQRGPAGTWSPVGAGLPAKPVISLHVSFTSRRRRLLAGLQQGGVWSLEPGAKTWVANLGSIRHESVNDMCVSGENVLIATDSGVFRSRNRGATWQMYSDGLLNVRQVNRVVLSGDQRTAFCGEVGGLYVRLVT